MLGASDCTFTGVQRADRGSLGAWPLQETCPVIPSENCLGKSWAKPIAGTWEGMELESEGKATTNF